MFTSHFMLFLSLMRGDAALAEPVPATPIVVQQKTHRPRKLVSPAPLASALQPEAETPVPAPLALSIQAQPALQVAVAPSAAEVVGKVQDFYVQTKSFTASFQQTVTNQTFNKIKPKVSKGKVYILKPGKMRWDYLNESYKSAPDPKVSKSFISDSKHLWAVMHKNKQYYKEDLEGSTLPVALSFLMGTGDLNKDFNVELDTPGKYGSKEDLLLLLTPKTPSARYKKLWLVVDRADYSVKQSVVLNSKGDTNSIRFSGVKTNDGKLKAGHFIFNAKAHKDFKLIKAPEAPAPEGP